MRSQKIREVLDKRDARKKEERRMKEEGFDQIEFPVLVEDEEGSFHLFYDRQEVLRDPDLVWDFGESPQNARLIDSQGRIFTWHYNDLLKTYHPGSQEGVLTIDAVREMLNKYLGDILDKPEFGGEKSVRELFLKIDGYVQ
jgi:hypothetical protein